MGHHRLRDRISEEAGCRSTSRTVRASPVELLCLPDGIVLAQGCDDGRSEKGALAATSHM